MQDITRLKNSDAYQDMTYVYIYKQTSTLTFQSPLQITLAVRCNSQLAKRPLPHVAVVYYAYLLINTN